MRVYWSLLYMQLVAYHVRFVRVRIFINKKDPVRHRSIFRTNAHAFCPRELSVGEDSMHRHVANVLTLVPYYFVFFLPILYASVKRSAYQGISLIPVPLMMTTFYSFIHTFISLALTCAVGAVVVASDFLYDFHHFYTRTADIHWNQHKYIFSRPERQNTGDQYPNADYIMITYTIYA